MIFSSIPENEREGLLINLKSLSLLNPSAHIEHQIHIHDGSLKLYLWNYRAIDDESGEITGYTAQGINLSDRVRLSPPIPLPTPGSYTEAELLTPGTRDPCSSKKRKIDPGSFLRSCRFS